MKTTKSFKAALALMAGSILTAAVAACSPDEPVNEITKKLHEDPFKAVLTLQEGVLVGSQFNASPKMADFKPSAQPAQQIVWETIPGKGWQVTSKDKGFKVKNHEDYPDVVYSLRFDYYNVEGKPMNNQFFDNGQDRIHQHFFSVYKKITAPDGTVGNRRETKKENLPFDYNYADEYNGNYIAETNPMGFQGFIRFLRPGAAFQLNIEVLHAPKSKLEDDGKSSPFYLPSKTNLSTGLWDIVIAVPVQTD